MKKLLLAGSFLFAAATPVVAQDYRAYVPQRPAYFHSNNAPSFWFYDETRGIAEDTTWVNGSHRIVKSYQEEIASGPGSQFSACFQLDTSWVGVAIEQDTITWETWFFNYEGDTVKFNPAAGLGQSGLVCRMMNGNVMRGIVTSVTQGSIMSVTDSIRVITLNLEDQFGSPLPSDMNGKTILLGKQHGLIKTYIWNDFPNDTSAYTLYGMENPVQGARIITAQEIYDYNIGDRFDWYTVYNSNSMQNPNTYNYYTWIITGKTVNGNTVTYNYTEDWVYMIGNTVLNQHWALAGTAQYVLGQFDTLYEFNHRPFDILQYPDTTLMWGNSFSTPTMPYAPSQVNGRQLKGYIFGSPYYYDTATHCFSGLTVSWGPCDGEHSVYGEGIGKVYSKSGGSAFCFGTYNLVYYEKGAETWGTPHNWSVILSAPEQSNESVLVRSWPNPASDVLNIALPAAESKNLTYQIYTVSGQLAVSGNAPVNGGILQIPVNQLAEGAYTVVISGESQSWISRFVR